jgi:acyl-CoA thioesterase
LFGGAGLGAAISALEGSTSREVVWATSQYLAHAEAGELLDVDVTVAVEGYRVTQARAVGRVGDREVLTVNAALGERPDLGSGQFEIMPEAPHHDVCPPRRRRTDQTGTINERLDIRVAKGRAYDEMDGAPGDGRTLMWAHLPEVIEGVDAAALAVLGDFVPSGVGQALGGSRSVRSLDNTLRVVNLVPTEWVLLDIRVHGVGRGFGHGLVHMFAEDGKGSLMATASQSCIVRERRRSAQTATEQIAEQAAEVIEGRCGEVSDRPPA